MGVNIACVQETRWVGSRARYADGYKLWYSGVRKGKNGVGILVDEELRESVVEVRRVNDRLMTIKLVVGECTLNIVSIYALHAGRDEEVKRRFWEGLDKIVLQVPPIERLFIRGGFNGHIGSTACGYGEVHGGLGFGERNGGGTSLLDFAKAFGLVIANSSFPKRGEHLVRFPLRLGESASADKNCVPANACVRNISASAMPGPAIPFRFSGASLAPAISLPSVLSAPADVASLTNY
uniref:Craniofacial development protein 2-like n=1 Tax=Nicotiana tabacum TaxID=4097 RepID=A0A1S4D8W7_TOBAC|nr:PREDICTED: craniofacial development protein 2-like [Nicotiana tabacum]